jgi:hypothetical protein
VQFKNGITPQSASLWRPYGAGAKRLAVFLHFKNDAIGPSRQFQRLTISVAIGAERTWLDPLMVLPGRE